MIRPAIALLAWCALAAMLCSACGPSQRQRTLRASLIALNAARDGFVAWDARQQQQIVERATSREAGEDKLAEHRSARSRVVDTLELAYRALAVAATQTDQASARAAVRLAADAVRVLTGVLR